MKKFFTVIATIAGIGFATGAQAHDVLGAREVGYSTDRDVIRVHQDRPYNQIRLCVSKHAVRFHDVDVVYRNGGRQDLKVLWVIPKDECTRWIDLAGRDRWLREIIFRYDTYGNSGPRAVVTAYGR